MTQEKFEERVLAQLDKIHNRLSKLEQDTAWIRGKLQGRGERSTDIKAWIAIAVAIAAAILAGVK